MPIFFALSDYFLCIKSKDDVTPDNFQRFLKIPPCNTTLEAIFNARICCDSMLQAFVPPSKTCNMLLQQTVALKSPSERCLTKGQL